MTDRDNPLRIARLALGLTPTAAAKALGISTRHVHTIELKPHKPTADLREAIRQLYGAEVLEKYERLVKPWGSRWAKPQAKGGAK
jgi:transcriptional regulator with XRE-family HTH domain